MPTSFVIDVKNSLAVLKVIVQVVGPCNPERNFASDRISFQVLKVIIQVSGVVLELLVTFSIYIFNVTNKTKVNSVRYY